MYFFITFLITQMIFPRNKSEISPFLSMIYNFITKKRVGWSPQEILSHSTSRNILIRPEGTIIQT